MKHDDLLETPRTNALDIVQNPGLEWTRAEIEQLGEHAMQLERELIKAHSALKPFAELLDGNLESVGGGTLIAPTIKVQNVKDARAALQAPQIKVSA